MTNNEEILDCDGVCDTCENCDDYVYDGEIINYKNGNVEPTSISFSAYTPSTKYVEINISKNKAIGIHLDDLVALVNEVKSLDKDEVKQDSYKAVWSNDKTGVEKEADVVVDYYPNEEYVQLNVTKNKSITFSWEEWDKLVEEVRCMRDEG